MNTLPDVRPYLDTPEVRRRIIFLCDTDCSIPVKLLLQVLRVLFCVQFFHTIWLVFILASDVFSQISRKPWKFKWKDGAVLWKRFYMWHMTETV